MGLIFFFWKLVMPEKVVISPPANQWALWSIPIIHWRVGLLTVLVLVGMVLVWSIDGCTVKHFIEAWRYRQDYLAVTVRSHSPNLTLSHQNLTLLSICSSKFGSKPTITQ